MAAIIINGGIFYTTKRLELLPAPKDDLMGLRRILHECKNDREPELTAQLDAVDALMSALNDELQVKK